jgi:hypothetical protein
MPVHNYIPGQCWYGIKPQKIGGSTTCAVQTTTRYRIQFRNSLMAAHMYLCDRHKLQMERDGYEVTAEYENT